MIKNRNHFFLVAIFLLASTLCSCKGGHYSAKVSKLHAGMTSANVVAALGMPYGEANGMEVYYDAGASTILAVQPNENGDCGWLLLEVPPSGISQGFAYYKVLGSSGSSPAFIGATIFRNP